MCLVRILSRFFFSADSQLVPEDPEGKKDEYAFDNPAFKTGEPGTGTTSGKTSSPLDPSWTSTTTSAKQNSLDKRKTVDDSCINVSFVVCFFFFLYKRTKFNCQQSASHPADYDQPRVGRRTPLLSDDPCGDKLFSEVIKKYMLS